LKAFLGDCDRRLDRPVPRLEIVETRYLMFRRKSLMDTGQIDERSNCVELIGLDQQDEDRGLSP
jgi:hypothetical protein